MANLDWIITPPDAATMIDPALFLAYLAAAVLLTITPGLDTAMVLRQAALEGPRSALLAAFGVALGCLVWGLAAAVGLGAVLQASEAAYVALKWVGAAYLAWLGLRLIVRPRSALGSTPGWVSRSSGFAALRRGLLTNLSNPKAGLFYAALLPQFVPEGANVALYSFFLAAVHASLGLIWFSCLIAATAPIARILRRPSVLRALDRTMGVVFLGFAVKLVASHR